MRAKYTETADISERKSGRMPSFGTGMAKNQVQAESQANTDQEAVRERTMESKEGGASKIICQGKSRARICGHKGTTPVSKNAIPGSAKTDRQTEYAVRAGELGSG